MPRTGRKARGGVVYHVFNRGNGRARIFHKPADYDAFVRLLAAVRATVGMRVLAFCLMPNHWHLVLWPREDGDLSGFMLRLCTAHVRRRYAHSRATAGGHLYQGRFKAFPVQPEDFNFLCVCRYVEANGVRAKLVRRARDWRWSSLRARTTGAAGGVAAGDLLDEWPVDRPADAAWEALVDRPAPPGELEQLRTSLRRGRPFGTEGWTKKVAGELGLGFTLRAPGRPPRESNAPGGAGDGRKPPSRRPAARPPGARRPRGRQG
jgi:putative transposase